MYDPSIDDVVKVEEKSNVDETKETQQDDSEAANIAEENKDGGDINDIDEDDMEEETEVANVEEEVQEKKDNEETVEGDVQENAEAKEEEESPSYYAVFKGVDASVATLTIDVSDLDIPLGSSAIHDVGPLCEIDVLGGVSKKVSNLEVAIVPNGVEDVVGAASNDEIADLETTDDSENFQDAVSEEDDDVEKTQEEGVEEVDGEKEEEIPIASDSQEKEEEQKGDGEEIKEIEQVDTTKEDEVEQKESEEVVATDKVEEQEDEVEVTNDDEKEESDIIKEESDITKEEGEEEVDAADTSTSTTEKTTTVIVPTCILHFKVEYDASTRDQMVILTEKYNSAVARQAVAVDKLRKIAISVRRAQMAAAVASPSNQMVNKKPAVKPGFLEKKTNKKEPMFLSRWYQKTLGPNSLLRKVYPIAKNYILFFGGIILMHYQGHNLALPPPV